MFPLRERRIPYTDFVRHILSNISRVVSRDSSRTSATLNDLFVAICEDVTLYGTFKAMKGGWFIDVNLSPGQIADPNCSV